MKLIFNLFLGLYLSTNAFSREIIVISFKEKKPQVIWARELLLQKFKIPISLVTEIEMSNPCEPIDESILQICIDEKNEYRIPVSKGDILRKSFTIFYRQEGKNE